MYRLEDTYDNAYSMYEIGVTYCYDHVWMAAVALNCTDSYLKLTGRYTSTFNLFGTVECRSESFGGTHFYF